MFTLYHKKCYVWALLRFTDLANHIIPLLFADIAHTFNQLLARYGIVAGCDPVMNLFPFNCPVIFNVVNCIIASSGIFGIFNTYGGKEVLCRYLIVLFFSYRDVSNVVSVVVTRLKGPRVELDCDEN